MTPGPNDPALERRRVIVALRSARRAAGLTQRQAAAAVEWSESKLRRIEAGTSSASQVDLQVLLTAYGVTDADLVADLCGATRKGRYSNWSQYAQVLSPPFINYLGLEAAAVAIRQSEPLLIPSLLQTKAYSRELMKTATRPGATEQDLETLDKVRIRRQDLFDTTVELDFIMTEVVLRRLVGTSEVMRSQIRRLLEFSLRPNVKIQVLPLSAGLVLGLAYGFTILEFDGGADEVLEYRESAQGDHIAMPPRRHNTLSASAIFEEMRTVSSRASDFPEMAQRYIASFAV